MEKGSEFMVNSSVALARDIRINVLKMVHSVMHLRLGHVFQ